MIQKYNKEKKYFVFLVIVLTKHIFNIHLKKDQRKQVLKYVIDNVKIDDNFIPVKTIHPSER